MCVCVCVCACATQATALAAELPPADKAVSSERTNREMMELQLVKRAQQEMSVLRASIIKEQKAREVQQEAVLVSLDEAVTEIQAELEQEREERIRMEETMLMLMEAVTSKFALITAMQEV